MTNGSPQLKNLVDRQTENQVVMTTGKTAKSGSTGVGDWLGESAENRNGNEGSNDIRESSYMVMSVDRGEVRELEVTITDKGGWVLLIQSEVDGTEGGGTITITPAQAVVIGRRLIARAEKVMGEK